MIIGQYGMFDQSNMMILFADMKERQGEKERERGGGELGISKGKMFV